MNKNELQRSGKHQRCGFVNRACELSDYNSHRKDVSAMTKETEDAIIASLNAYADRVLGDIDPQKVKIGAQLAAIRPEMERLAALHHMDITDLFVLYMDRCSEIFALQEADLQEVLRQL